MSRPVEPAGQDAVAVLALGSAEVRRRLLYVLIGLAVVVFVVTFALSWDALMQLARASYIDPHLATAFPLTVDALAVTSFIAGVLLSRHGWSIRAQVIGVTLMFGALSIIGNGLHAYQRGGRLHIPQWEAVAVSAVPPVSGMVMIHLFTLLLRHLVGTADTATPGIRVTVEAGNGIDDAEVLPEPEWSFPDGDAQAELEPVEPVGALSLADGASKKARALAELDQIVAAGGNLSEPGFNADMAARYEVSVSQVEKWKALHRRALPSAAGGTG